MRFLGVAFGLLVVLFVRFLLVLLLADAVVIESNVKDIFEGYREDVSENGVIAEISVLERLKGTEVGVNRDGAEVVSDVVLLILACLVSWSALILSRSYTIDSVEEAWLVHSSSSVKFIFKMIL
jgi:hypothetical protein